MNTDQTMGRKLDEAADEAWSNGVDARRAGKLVQTNPHRERGSIEWNAWRGGWLAEDFNLGGD